MKKYLVLSVTILVFTVFVSCNKNKRNAKTLEGTTWLITEISINAVIDTLHPKLEFLDGDMYKKVLEGNWYNSNLTTISSKFAWQFRDHGKTFEISNLSEGVDAIECSNFSGVYSVIKSSKTSYEFSSQTTHGYYEKTIIIKMKKQ